MLKEDGVTPADPFDRGAGALRVDTAVAAVVTISETPEGFVGSMGSPRDRVDLNLPSISTNPLPGALTTKRTLQNVTGKDQEFKVSATATNGVRITVSPKSFTVPARQARTITVTIDGTAAPDGWSFGQVTLTPDEKKVPRWCSPGARVADSEVPDVVLLGDTESVTIANGTVNPAPLGTASARVPRTGPGAAGRPTPGCPTPTGPSTRPRRSPVAASR